MHNVTSSKNSVALSSGEHLLLLDLIDACHREINDSQFEYTVYPKLRQLLPHETFVYAHADLRLKHIQYYAGVRSHTKGQRMPVEDALECPVIRTWIKTRQPVHYRFDPPRVLRNLSPNLNTFSHRAIGGLYAHGVMDGIGVTASCYFFLCTKDTWSPRTETLVRWVIPHLHTALGTTGPKPIQDPTLPLTPREREILEKVAHGRTDSQIATELRVSACTIRTHMRNIIQKLNASNRTHAVTQALNRGFVPPQREVVVSQTFMRKK